MSVNARNHLTRFLVCMNSIGQGRGGTSIHSYPTPHLMWTQPIWTHETQYITTQNKLSWEHKQKRTKSLSLWSITNEMGRTFCPLYKESKGVKSTMFCSSWTLMGREVNHNSHLVPFDPIRTILPTFWGVVSHSTQNFYISFHLNSTWHFSFDSLSRKINKQYILFIWHIICLIR